MRGLLPFDGFSVIRRWIISSVMLRLHTKTMCLYPRWILRIKDFYEITCDMPGFTKDQISISYENGILSLSAQKEEQTEEKDDDRHYIRRERSSSVFRRQFNVKGIKEDGIKAGLKDGILTITLPKLRRKLKKHPIVSRLTEDDV
ncbi:MAG: Hsp20/alpha crystallin family protein [Dialister invisus]